MSNNAGSTGGGGDGDKEISNEDVWTVVSALFRSRGFVQNQIDSFNEFFNQTLPEMVTSTVISFRRQRNNYETIHSITFLQLHWDEPTLKESDGEVADLYPNIARLRNFTYSASLYVDVCYKMIKKKLNSNCEEEIESQRFNKVHIGKVPIMLKSDVCRLHGKSEKELTELRECPFDEGGYFIVNGIDRVLIGQERMSTNHVYVFQMRQPNKYAYVAEFRSRVKYPNRQPGPLFVRMLSKTRAKMGIRATLSSIREEIPIVIVFRALGVISDKQIIECMCYDILDTEMTVLLQPSLEEACYIRNQELVLEYIGKLGAPASVTEKEERIKYAKDILKMEMLPHVDDSGPFVGIKKSHNFGYIIHRLLLCALNRRAADDRDNFGNKRLDLAGPLLGSLFGMLFSKFTGEVQSMVKKFVDEEKDFKLDAIIAKKEKIITSGLKYSLATGNWSKSNAGDKRTGVSQVLNRITNDSTLSHLRRISSPIGREVKLAKPMQLHNTQWGMICPVETPVGKACGLVKNLALMVHITVGSAPDLILDCLKNLELKEIEDISTKEMAKGTKIFVSGCWVGIHRDPDKMVKTLRNLRRRHVSITLSCFLDGVI